jgi:hypothetical protein
MNLSEKTSKIIEISFIVFCIVFSIWYIADDNSSIFWILFVPTGILIAIIIKRKFVIPLKKKKDDD